MKQLARAAAAAAVLLAPAAAAVAAVAPAGAVTSACASDPFCGGQTLKSPALALAAASDTARTLSPVVVAVPSASSRQDWDMRNPANPVNNDKIFTWAPNGIRSGLCMSDPFTSVRKPIQLRRCNGSEFQRWTPALGGDGYVVWVNDATGFALTAPPGAVPGTGLQGRSVGQGTGSNKLWIFTPPPVT